MFELLIFFYLLVNSFIAGRHYGIETLYKTETSEMFMVISWTLLLFLFGIGFWIFFFLVKVILLINRTFHITFLFNIIFTKKYRNMTEEQIDNMKKIIRNFQYYNPLSQKIGYKILNFILYLNR